MLRVPVVTALAAAVLNVAVAQAATPLPADSRPASTTTFAVECRRGDRIRPDERTAVEGVAQSLFQHLVVGELDDAFALLSPEIQRQVGRESFGKALAFVKTNGVYGAPRVTHAYLLDVIGDPPEETTSCEGADGLPEAYVAIEAGVRQAHVVIEAGVGGERWAFTTWLRQGASRWDVYAIDVRNVGVGDLGAAEIFAMARTQRDRGHSMSAWLLYRAARGLVSRGDYFSLPLQADIDADIRAFDATLLEPGELPIYWTSGRTTFGVQDAATASLNGRLWIQLRRWTSVWPGERAMKAENRRVLAAFLKAHPDWSESFTGVELKSMHPDGRQSVSTLYSRDRGFYETDR